MFHTYPESAARVSFELSPGRRSWSWFELGINIPLYLVNIEVPVEEITRQFIFSDFGTVLRNLDQHPLAEEGGRLSALYLIAPNYLSGGQHPTLVELAEVWAQPGRYSCLHYVARDGQRLRFTMMEPTPESELECVLKIGAPTKAPD